LILEHCWNREKSSCRFHREERRKRKVDNCDGRERLVGRAVGGLE
jgi:hypothetical protein